MDVEKNFQKPKAIELENALIDSDQTIRAIKFETSHI